MRKYVAEFLGTFVLVFVGTGAVVLAKGDTLTIGLSFGLAVMMMAYAVGNISGGHFNSAVTLGFLIKGDVTFVQAIGYWISQFIGAIVASFVVQRFTIALHQPANQLGQTDFPTISAGMAFGFEALITFLFVFIILMVTSDQFGNAMMAPLVIGITLGFMIIVALNLTGGSLNPARSFGPAILAGGSALAHYWVYFCAPLVGSAIAAFVARWFLAD
ncbi:MIP/aquaporin family protein [Levilactobacillus bambusae]|uniref:Aquaporin n=1 Tax=Levilactobacillus bambusae TaxID=2024736 RepID=A0A2V1N0D7_9LACO|nr:aquaporin [Levilactobacillus bambusae]PWG00709.1 aquaporin [Levilactobacillus bambusae]